MHLHYFGTAFILKLVLELTKEPTAFE